MCFILPVPPKGGKHNGKGYKQYETIRITNPSSRQSYTSMTSALPPCIISSKTRIGTKPPISIETEYLCPPSPPPKIRSPVREKAETEKAHYSLPSSLLDELIKDKLCSKVQSTALPSPANEIKNEPANDQLMKQEEKLDRLTATINGFVSDVKVKEQEAEYKSALGQAMEQGIEEGWKKGQAHALLELEMERKERKREKQRAMFAGAQGYPNRVLFNSHSEESMAPYPNRIYSYGPPMLVAPDVAPNMFTTYSSGYTQFPSEPKPREFSSASTNSHTSHSLHRKLNEGFESLGSQIEELVEDGRTRHRDTRQEMRRGLGRMGDGLDRVGYGLENVGYGLERVERDMEGLGWGMHDIRGEVRGWRRRVPLSSPSPFGGYGNRKPSF